MATKAARKRELIDAGTAEHFIRRDETEQFDESDEVSRTLGQDVRRETKPTVPAGPRARGLQKSKK